MLSDDVTRPVRPSPVGPRGFDEASDDGAQRRASELKPEPVRPSPSFASRLATHRSERKQRETEAASPRRQDVADERADVGKRGGGESAREEAKDEECAKVGGEGAADVEGDVREEAE